LYAFHSAAAFRRPFTRWAVANVFRFSTSEKRVCSVQCLVNLLRRASFPEGC
jgi:hypothetical protein